MRLCQAGLLAQDIKVLMVAPLTAEALTPIVKQAMASVISVVALDRELHTEVTCHIGAKNVPIGAAAAALLIEKLRVIDSSIMPVLISGNTNGPSMMIGEKGADLIKGVRRPAKLSAIG